MDKLFQKIIIIAGVLLLLVATYLAITVLPGQIEELNNEELKGETGDIVIITSSTEYVESVNISNENGSYTFERNENGSWGIKEHADKMFENISLESTVYSLTNLKAIEEVDMPEDLSEFGFTEPRASAKILMKNGGEREFVLGSSVKGGTGDFLLDVTENKAYVVSVYTADNFEKTVNDYRKTKLASVTADDIVKLSVTNKNGKVVMELAQSHYDSSELVFKMTYPRDTGLDETITSGIFEKINDITVIDYIEDNPADLSIYGLANPVLTVEIETENEKHVIKYGDKTEKGSVYTMIDDMDFVFTHSATLYNSCVNITPYSLMNKFVNIANINEVASITVEGKGKKHTLEIKGNDDFYIDGNQALAEPFRKTYQSIIGIKGSGLAENNVNSSAEYSVNFVYKDGSETKIVYASYDDMNYYAEVNGERVFITLKKGLDDMMAVVETLAKNPMKKNN